jgi:hypothetical protein
MVGKLRILLVPLFAVALVAGLGTPASASCAGPPAVSPYAFTGTVESTEAGGRIAQVVTDDGGTVEVRGASTPCVVTSADRYYSVGRRYEFHPLNATSPYEDNACTATHEVGPAPTQGFLGMLWPW